VSSRQRERTKLYLQARTRYLAEHRRCEACWQAEATEIHHTKGRIGVNLLDVATWKPVCRRCHEWIHANPVLATAKGWMTKR